MNKKKKKDRRPSFVIGSLLAPLKLPVLCGVREGLFEKTTRVGGGQPVVVSARRRR